MSRFRKSKYEQGFRDGQDYQRRLGDNAGTFQVTDWSKVNSAVNGGNAPAPQQPSVRYRVSRWYRTRGAGFISAGIWLLLGLICLYFFLTGSSRGIVVPWG